MNKRINKCYRLIAFSVLSCLLPVAVFFSHQAHALEGSEELSIMAVQDGGRIKPYDSFAREALQLIYGKSTYNGKPASHIVMTWLLAPEVWEEKKLVRLDHEGLKDVLKLPRAEKYFTPQDLMTNPRLDLAMRELQSMRQNNQKLDPYFQAVSRLENQLLTFHALRAGALRVVPPKEGSTWVSLGELDGGIKESFITLTKGFAAYLAEESPKNVSNTSKEKKQQSLTQFNAQVADFRTRARAENPPLYPSDAHLTAEVHYNELHPFRISYSLYLLAAILGVIAFFTRWKWARLSMWGAAVLGFLLHTYGFYLRVSLTGRPPVSNMYETVIWVAWGVIFFAFIFEALKRRIYFLTAGAITGVVCMVIADNSPAILDASLQPLEPVLRSNMWLIIHVMTIVLSYAPLFFAFALGVFGLSLILKGESENSERVRQVTQACYRNIQIGVVLLAAGTILGGIWADYSWGRFWGWDPKETWAFIAVMGYLAVLHARLGGLLKNFGLLAFAVVAFNLVVMAWYGVNYILGAGLHSYGFGAGGVEWVAGFCGGFLLFTVYAAHVHYFKRRAKISK